MGIHAKLDSLIMYCDAQSARVRTSGHASRLSLQHGYEVLARSAQASDYCHQF